MNLGVKLRDLFLDADNFLFIRFPNDTVRAEAIIRVSSSLDELLRSHNDELTESQTYEIFRRVFLPLMDCLINEGITEIHQNRFMVRLFSASNFLSMSRHYPVWVRLAMEGAREYLSEVYLGTSETVLNSMVICG